MSTEGNELYQARLRIAERIGPDEDYLKAHLAYRPALSAADLIEYAGYAWGWFVAAGGMAAVGAIAHGAAEKLGENVSEAAWKRLTKVSADPHSNHPRKALPQTLPRRWKARMPRHISYSLAIQKFRKSFCEQVRLLP